MNSHRNRALILTRFGTDFAACTRIETLPLPRPGPREVAVRVVYAGVNGVLDHNMARNKVAFRTFTVPCGTGVECIGVVTDVGAGVGGLKVGDAVICSEVGLGYREHLIVTPAQLVLAPAATSEFLTLHSTGVSALVGLERVGDLRGGETVLVTAAAGGLGHIAAQLAKRADNHVIGVTGSEAKAAALRGLGIDRVINYRTESLAGVLASEYPKGIDLAYDSVGGTMFDTLVENLAPRGRLVSSGFTSDKLGEPEIVSRPRIYHQLYAKAASIRGYMNPLFHEYGPDAIARLFAMYRAGEIKVLIDPTPFVGLESVAAAGAFMRRGGNCGKVVVTVDAELR